MASNGQAFRHSATVTLDAAGNGEVTAQPPGVIWAVAGLSVETSTQALHPRADITINGGFVEGTYSGHRDASNSQHRIDPTDQITCTWTGGDPGARATLRLWGRQYNQGEY